MTSSAFILSVISGVIASILVLLGDRLLRRAALSRMYGRFQGTYTVRRKGHPDESPMSKIRITVRGDRFELQGEVFRKEGTHHTEGSIQFSSLNHQMGSGYYYHLENEGSGRYDVVLKPGDREILVHRIYMTKTKELNQQAYVWSYEGPL